MLQDFCEVPLHCLIDFAFTRSQMLSLFFTKASVFKEGTDISASAPYGSEDAVLDVRANLPLLVAVVALEYAETQGDTQTPALDLRAHNVHSIPKPARSEGETGRWSSNRAQTCQRGRSNPAWPHKGRQLCKLCTQVDRLLNF